MKYLIASDLHGSARYCRALLEMLRREQADRLVLLGDLLYHGPRNPLPEEYDTQSVAAMLGGVAERVLCVRGNCDSEVDQMLIEYPMMGDYAWITLPERSFFLTHGHVFSPEDHPPLPAGTVLAFGHIHTPVAEKDGDVYYFNPGSASLPKNPYKPSWGRDCGGRL